MSSCTKWRRCLGVQKFDFWAGKGLQRLVAAVTDIKLYSVVKYGVSTGSIMLEHAFPQQMCPTPTVLVDLQLVLESLKVPDVQRGSWLNVIGYVRKSEQRYKKTGNPSADDVRRGPIPNVQAIIVWDAGAIRVGDYEAALTSQREKRAAIEGLVVHQSQTTNALMER
jgi:hypothetical protein